MKKTCRQDQREVVTEEGVGDKKEQKSLCAGDNDSWQPSVANSRGISDTTNNILLYSEQNQRQQWKPRQS